MDGNRLQEVGIVGESIEDVLLQLVALRHVSHPVSGTGPAEKRPPEGTNVAGADPHADELLTVREVAYVLKLSTATVYELIDGRRIPAVRVAGAFWRVRRGDLAITELR